MKTFKIALISVLLVIYGSSYFVRCSREEKSAPASEKKTEQKPAALQQLENRAQNSPGTLSDTDEQKTTTTGQDAALKSAQVKSSGVKVTFVELGSVNCIPCKMMQPVMKEIEHEYGDQVRVVFHDVWTPQGQPFGQQYGIRAIPTQVFLDENGKEYYRHTGFFPKEELVKILAMKGVK